MADVEQYDSSVSNSLAAQNANATAKAADDQKAAQSKGAEGAAAAKKAGGLLGGKPSPDSSGSASSPAAQSRPGGLIGAIKKTISPAASPAAPVTNGAVPGGNSMVPVDSPKGQALTQDPKDNLASKGRFSDYRKVFKARGLAGKHSWGGK